MLKKLVIFLIISRLVLIIYAGGVLKLANHWDGPHYIYLSEHGYTNTGDEANFMVFLPFYPLIVYAFNFLINNSLLTSVIVSNGLFILAGIFFYKLLRNDYSEKFSALATALMAIFPTSYFFSSSYPESLFVLLFCLSFYYLKKRTLIASISSGLATLTRPFGILLWPALIAEVLKLKRQVPRILILVLFAALSVSAYLLINLLVYNDPLAFQKILNVHWQKSFAFPWQGIYQSWRVAVLSTKWDEYRIFVGLSEAITSTIAWIFVPLAFYKPFKLRLSYAIYYTLGVIFFTSTGFILSAPRYLLSLPPFFIILANLLKFKALKISWIVVSATLLIILTKIASQGRWAF